MKIIGKVMNDGDRLIIVDEKINTIISLADYDFEVVRKQKQQAQAEYSKLSEDYVSVFAGVMKKVGEDTRERVSKREAADKKTISEMKTRF
jgi:hypothetical protein